MNPAMLKDKDVDLPSLRRFVKEVMKPWMEKYWPGAYRDPLMAVTRTDDRAAQPCARDCEVCCCRARNFGPQFTHLSQHNFKIIMKTGTLVRAISLSTVTWTAISSIPRSPWSASCWR